MGLIERFLRLFKQQDAEEKEGDAQDMTEAEDLTEKVLELLKQQDAEGKPFPHKKKIAADTGHSVEAVEEAVRGISRRRLLRTPPRTDQFSVKEWADMGISEQGRSE